MATKDEMKNKRAKELAIIKASNELLEDIKQGLLERNNADEGVLLQLDAAQKENLLMARNTYGASEKDVKDAVYHGPSDEEIKKYEKHLTKKGLTDEQLHQKDITKVVSTSKKQTTKSSKKEEIKAEEKTEEKPRRKRRTKKEVDVKTEVENLKDALTEAATEDKTVEVAKTEPVKLSDITNKRVKYDETYNIEDYDLTSIPSYVQYDMIPLPSKGECYKHKKSRVPVAYLTAADENIINSPNMYRDGKILDIILRRKILDKDFNVDNLSSGDRDAILLWLRATAYGDEFPIVASNPATGLQYNTTIKLSDFKYNDFDLKSDENALFEYKTNNGDVIKYRYLTHGDEMKLREQMTANTTNKNVYDILDNCKQIKDILEEITELSDEDKSMANEDIDEIITIIGEEFKGNYENTIPSFITDQMVAYTFSINGKTDEEYKRGYIENMRVGDALEYRRYYNTHKPSVDLSITIDIPESDGGGSFNTFLRIEDTLFVNY